MTAMTFGPVPVPATGTVTRGRAGAGSLRLTARGRWVLTVLAVLLVAPVVLWGGSALAGDGGAAVPVEPYTVVAGETWWSIASSIAEPGQDVRDVVRALQDLNGVSGALLHAGQQVLVPAHD